MMLLPSSEMTSGHIMSTSRSDSSPVSSISGTCMILIQQMDEMSHRYDFDKAKNVLVNTGPYKNRATKVARPNPNIYDLFRCNEVVYADAAGNAICVKRSRIELLKAYIKMLKVFRLIDLHYDKVCEIGRASCRERV